MSTFLRDILSKGRIWESVSQREVGDHSQITILYLRLNSRSSFNFGLYPQVEKQVRREEALERLLARQEETAVLVRGLVEQVQFAWISFVDFLSKSYSFCVYIMSIFILCTFCIFAPQMEELRQQGKGIKRQLKAIQDEKDE